MPSCPTGPFISGWRPPGSRPPGPFTVPGLRGASYHMDPETPATPSDTQPTAKPDGVSLPSTPRRRGPDRVPRRPRGTDGAEISVAGMAAQGISVRRIGRAMAISEGMVKEIRARPHVQTYVAECREATRHLLVDRVLSVAADTADWAADEAQAAHDPRTLKSLTGALLDLERVSASASGESRPVTQVAVVNQMGEEAAELIRALLGSHLGAK